NAEPGRRTPLHREPSAGKEPVVLASAVGGRPAGPGGPLAPAASSKEREAAPLLSVAAGTCKSKKADKRAPSGREMAAILILGGVGFIGRNLVCYLVENNLAAKIRVVDKVLPETAYLSKRCQDAFQKVEFMQGNLVKPGKLGALMQDRGMFGAVRTVIDKIFDGHNWDAVFNLAAETKYGQPEAVGNVRLDF
ncbi:MAG: hypothetical protein BJ554DRAFT_7127, partial [Olpidium bornovanus]